MVGSVIISAVKYINTLRSQTSDHRYCSSILTSSHTYLGGEEVTVPFIVKTTQLSSSPPSHSQSPGGNFSLSDTATGLKVTQSV